MELSVPFNACEGLWSWHYVLSHLRETKLCGIGCLRQVKFCSSWDSEFWIWCSRASLPFDLILGTSYHWKTMSFQLISIFWFWEQDVIQEAARVFSSHKHHSHTWSHQSAWKSDHAISSCSASWGRSMTDRGRISCGNGSWPSEVLKFGIQIDFRFIVIPVIVG